MARQLDPQFASAIARVLPGTPTIVVPFDERAGLGPVAGLLGAAEPAVRESLPRVTIFRPGDLVRIEFRFVNLARSDSAAGPVLRRGDARSAAYILAVFGPQHVLEEAYFDSSGPPGPFVTEPPPAGDQNRAKPDPGHPSEAPRYPVPARIARPSRVALVVTDETIVFSEAGLLHALRALPLSVAPHAEGAAPLLHWEELAARAGAFESLRTRTRAARSAAVRRSAARSALVFTDLTEAVRLRRTASELAARYGAIAAVAATAPHIRPGLEIGPGIRIDVRPPVPRAPLPTETALEIPWRLQLSPHSRGAFTHALREVAHEGRVELWHSRLGTRTDAAPDLDPQSPAPVDETDDESRTVRAVWTRDFTPGNGPAERDAAFPYEDFGDPATLPPFRASLSARDRMQLVHLTSNHRYPRYRPRPANVERLLLTAAGGWLDLHAAFEPRGGLTIEEWRHRATLGRDHYVKVVYRGVLLPFGHRASLVKVTERRVKDDGFATLYQRLFIVVRERDRRFLNTGSPAFDHTMPLRWVRILTAETPPLALPETLPALRDSMQKPKGQLFEPRIVTGDGAATASGVEPFRFRFVANDIANHVIEFEGPMVFAESSVFETGSAALKTEALAAANAALGPYPFLGQRVAYAPPLDPDDTTLPTERIRFASAFDTATSDASTNYVLPVMSVARAPVPAMSAFTGQEEPRTLVYAHAYRDHGVGTGPDPHPGNEGGLFLQLADDAGTPLPEDKGIPMAFSTQSQRSGAFVSPGLGVTALARRVGPVGGDLGALASDLANVDVGKMFPLDNAKLFGILPLAELLPAGGSPLPAFVTKAVNAVVDLGQTAGEARALLTGAMAGFAARGADLADDAQAVVDAAAAVVDALALVLQPPHPTQPFAGLLGTLGTAARRLAERLREIVKDSGTAALRIPRPDLERALGVLDRLAALAGSDEAETLADAIQAFASGGLLPERVSARLEWATPLVPWPTGSGDKAVFRPEGDGMLRLVSDVQAPLRGGAPTMLVSCALPPFTLMLLGDTRFLAIHVQVMEFSVQPGRKADVDVRLADGTGAHVEGIEFLGPLAFVNTLKDIIPLDGFSDPPYLDIQPSGLKAGFDLAVPDLAVGVFALTNIHLGAELSVPFIGESLEFRFFFATREDPFRLQVALFAGGGFFALTISPRGLKVIEAAFEFGAAVSMSFAVASGSLSVMAGIYFRLEIEGEQQAVQLTGYFRARGEVDVLGLISAAIEIYLELSYRAIGSASKAVGKASISIEVSVTFVSFSVTVSCEKQFSGSSGDPTFLDTMSPYADARGVERDPWAEYCDAFGVEPG